MKKKLLAVILCSLVSCNRNKAEEIKAEKLVKMYLDSLNQNTNNYAIIGYENVHPIYTTVEDEPNYEKYKNTPSKLDSINRTYSPKIRSWIIYVTFKGKDNYGNLGKHTYQCTMDKNLSKFVAGIEVDNLLP